MSPRVRRAKSRRGTGRTVLGLVLLLAAAASLLLIYIHRHFSKIIDARLAGESLQRSSAIFSAPRRISAGDPLTAKELAQYLRRSGYTEADDPTATGRFTATESAVEIRPSAHSYFLSRNALRVEFGRGRIARITSLETKAPEDPAEIEPEVLSSLFDRSSREKRRPVRYQDLPRVLVDAVLSAEDRRFFDHPGLDFIRILGAAWSDVRQGSYAEGASTITMQVARSFFFTTRREWKRKLAETWVALELESRFTKREIFELYANQIYLGNRGSFAIHGFGEAAVAYLGKDVRQLSLGEAAFLAGIIRSPNRYAAVERRPERAAEARDRVLERMLRDRLVTREEAEAARKTPLQLARNAGAVLPSAYFVDMVQDQILERYPENVLNSRRCRIYTTLDPDLQNRAVLAVEAGLKKLDTLLAPKYQRWRKRGESVPAVQAALVAMDPRSGAVRAIVGGRDYAQSQLNRVYARRQPGSVFKPFVYAAALQNAVDGSSPVVTPATMVDDSPTTFSFEGRDYSPGNYGREFHGLVTVRDALTLSMNVATVRIAEMVGYGHVAQVGKKLGIESPLQATPSLALGAYEMTPLDVAAAYTVFATNGVRAEPVLLESIVDSSGLLLGSESVRRRAVLDPRVAYLVTSILEDVVQRGTAANVRASGFTLPAAGKTGTSRDGWFAGFTSRLLCVVWVGFDDNRELGLSGSVSAAPIWTELMKGAASFPSYRQAEEFVKPAGVSSVMVDPETGQLSGTYCPSPRLEVFVEGSEPTEFCSRHGGGIWTALSPSKWLWVLKGKGEAAAPDVSDAETPGGMKPGEEESVGPGKKAERKPGFIRGIWDFLRGKRSDGKPDKDRKPR